MYNYVGSSIEIVLQLWDESPRFQRIGIPACEFDNIDSWVHEFTELSIWNILKTFGFSKEELNQGGFKIKLPDGEIQVHRPAHILTSLHTISTIKPLEYNYAIVCSPDEYFGMLLCRT